MKYDFRIFKYDTTKDVRDTDTSKIEALKYAAHHEKWDSIASGESSLWSVRKNLRAEQTTDDTLSQVLQDNLVSAQ